MVRGLDIVAYDPDGRIPLIVEVKSRTGTSSEWAARMRRNMLAHGALPEAKFLLLALPDRFYLWHDAINKADLIMPDYELKAEGILRPYFERAGVEPDNISGQSFELVVASWLADFQRSDSPLEYAVNPETRTILANLHEAIKGGHLEQEVGV